MEQKFLKCEHCGNIVAVVKNVNDSIICCGEKMKQIIPGTIEASREKHIPVYEIQENKVIVNIGSIDHPMVPEHYIEWVSLQTKFGNQRKQLLPNQAPKVCFALCDCDDVEAVYAYCNLHGLWMNKNE